MERPVVFYNQNQQINGILHSPTGYEAPCPAVAFFHGFTGTKVEPHRIFVKTARELAAIGFYVLRFDFRGSGDSEGDFSEMTIGGEVSDAIKSVDVLTAMQGVDAERIGILGLSMGGCVAAFVSGQDTRVKSTVMWAPLSDDPPDRKNEILGRAKDTPTPEEIALAKPKHRRKGVLRGTSQNIAFCYPSGVHRRAPRHTRQCGRCRAGLSRQTVL